MTGDKERLAILALTKGGQELAKRLAKSLAAETIHPGKQGIASVMQEIWPQYDGFIFIMATGIVVRAIAPLLHNKKSDPGVVVVDEAGKYAISLLSGHLGGANKLAAKIAAGTKGQAVITTASDTLGLTPIDLWARHNNLMLIQGSFTTLSAQLVNSGQLNIWTDIDGQLPSDFKLAAIANEADLIISNKIFSKGTAQLCPPNIFIGLGCNRGVKASEFLDSLAAICQENNLRREAVAGAASIDLKSDEAGLLEFCEQEALPITFYPASQLNSMNTNRSEVVFKATGAYGVCEPAALLRAATNKLLCGKTKWTNVTMALAEKKIKLRADYQ